MSGQNRLINNRNVPNKASAMTSALMNANEVVIKPKKKEPKKKTGK